MKSFKLEDPGKGKWNIRKKLEKAGIRKGDKK